MTDIPSGPAQRPVGGSPIDLWVDDEKSAPRGWTWVRSVPQAIEVLKTEQVRHLSLDYSLGSTGTGDDILYWLGENPEHWPTGDFTPISRSASANKLLLVIAARVAPKAPAAPDPEPEPTKAPAKKAAAKESAQDSTTSAPA